ncbi:MAG: peptidase S41 [Deltaproteobacteria bacterium]|nr:MAG: peptidase S41 [Deltaproteobacteria bacterium]
MSYIQKFWKLAVLIIAACGLLLAGTGFYQNLSAKDDKTPYMDLEVFADVLTLIQKNYVEDVESKKLVENSIKGMVHGLDPHSAYLPAEEFKEFKEDAKGEFGGVGIVITKENGRIVVISPIEGTPAYKAGIETGDVIIAVDESPTQEMSLWEAVKLMRGEIGKKVKLTIYRKSEKEPIVFDLTRAKIPLKSVKYAEIGDGYVYILITSFKERTFEELDEAMDKLRAKGEIKGLILDLRSNPGGLLDQAVSVSDYFLESGIIVSIKGRLKKNSTKYSASIDGTEGDYPVVVLINGGSASASEIVAGALQDHKRAVILGTSSFGKGSVQTVKPLKNGAALKYTIARYYTPSGRSIQAEGIKPDIITEYIRADKKDKKKKGYKVLKEKDLVNHLEAEPSKNNKKDEDKKDKDSNLIHSKDIKIENVKKDNQIQQAYNILVSYHLLNR